MKWALYNLTTTTQSGGVETSVWALARTLAARGHQVTIVGGRSDRARPEPGPDVEVRTCAYRPRESFPNLGSRARKLLERLSFARSAMPELRRGGFDRLLIFKPYDFAPALWARRAAGLKAGYLSGGTEFYPGYAMLARRLDYLGAVSAFNAGQIAEATGLTAQVNHLGVEHELFQPRPPDPELAALAGVGPEHEVVVTASRLVALKGVQWAMEAVARLAPARPALRLVVAGEGPYRAELAARAEGLGLADRVALVGFVPHERLPGLYALGRVAVFPSLVRESLGLAAAEALACGLPVVARDLGGLPEVVGPGGVLTAPRDVGAIAGGIALMLDDPRKREELARAGQARVRQMLDWGLCAQRLEEGLA